MLVYEQYFVAEDQCFGESLGSIGFCSDTKHDLRSVTESVTSWRVGIAIDRKLIKGADTPLFDYVPEYADLRTPEREGILLRHLLTVSARLELDQDVLALTLGIAGRACSNRGILTGSTLESALVTSPGGVFCYSSGGSELLGVAIRKAAKQPIENFGRDVPFGSPGIMDIT
jgi:CubicO group peptidase (beta-lactamase class C family)